MSDKPLVMTELPPISEQDTFIVFERNKKEYDFPLHRHSAYEINLEVGAAGVERIVGSSVSEIGDYDLVLLGGGIRHGWFNGSKSRDKAVYEVALQFSDKLFSDSLLGQRQFFAIREMLRQSAKGIEFDEPTAREAEKMIRALIATKDFDSIIRFLELLHFLAVSDYRCIDESRCKGESRSDSTAKMISYIQQHHFEPLTVSGISDYLNMSPASFSRLIRKTIGKSFVDYLNDVRIAAVIRDFVDQPDRNISEIAFSHGFRNLSHFNRVFRDKKGTTPRVYRNEYMAKTTVF